MGGRAAARNPFALGPALAVDALLAVARLDEAPLRLQRRDVGARELLGHVGKSGAARCEAFDQALVDGLSFAVFLLPVRGRNTLVALDQPWQMHRHQPPG